MVITAMPKRARWGGASRFVGGRRKWLTDQRHVGGRFGDIFLLARVHILAWLVAQTLGIQVAFPAKTQAQLSPAEPG